VWLLVVKGTYDSVEKVFLVASSFYAAYFVSAVMVQPDWNRALKATVTPVMMDDIGYIAILVGLVGTTGAPWMQFYLQAAIVEKGVDARQYKQSRIEVVIGSVMMSLIAFFIIVASAAAIWEQEPRSISDAAEAALALRPLGEYAYYLFAGGLLSASLFAASILPLSTAYTVCEGLGFESGVNKRFDEAPTFYWMYTLLIVVGAGMTLIPGFPLVRMILLSQVLNGILLPVILVFTVLLINREDLMGRVDEFAGVQCAGVCDGGGDGAVVADAGLDVDLSRRGLPGGRRRRPAVALFPDSGECGRTPAATRPLSQTSPPLQRSDAPVTAPFRGHWPPRRLPRRASVRGRSSVKSASRRRRLARR
jgi:Mn2+/Fe2+ NRAMP family transporter